MRQIDEQVKGSGLQVLEGLRVGIDVMLAIFATFTFSLLGAGRYFFIFLVVCLF